MKKIVLALAFVLVAFTGNSSLKGSILVNTISFADLPDKAVSPMTQVGVQSNSKTRSKASVCSEELKTTAKQTNFCVPVKSCTGA